jgi:hypothetical protein
VFQCSSPTQARRARTGIDHPSTTTTAGARISRVNTLAVGSATLVGAAGAVSAARPARPARASGSQAVRDRPAGEPIVAAFARFVLQPRGFLASLGGVQHSALKFSGSEPALRSPL